MRTTFTLTSSDRNRFNDLRDEQGQAFRFWREIAATRNLDHKSILSDDRGNHSALPIGHDKHWCWPVELKCKRPAVSVALK